MGTHPIFESDFDCLTVLEHKASDSKSVPKNSKMARTRAQAGPRRSPRIKRNQEQQQQQQQQAQQQAQQLQLTPQGRNRIRPPVEQHESGRPRLDFRESREHSPLQPSPPPFPVPANGDLARRTQISRDFYQSLMERHQLRATATTDGSNTRTNPRLAQVTILGHGERGNRLAELQLRVQPRARPSQSLIELNLGQTQRSSTGGNGRVEPRAGTHLARRTGRPVSVSSQSPNFLFANPRSRVYRNIQLSLVPSSSNSGGDATVQMDDVSNEQIQPSFDPEELQRLFWRDIFSLDIWNLDARSAGLTPEQFDAIETKTFKATRSTRHESCHVCLLDFENTQVLKRLPRCGHEFHPQCLKPWLEKHTTCPVCRERATKE